MNNAATAVHVVESQENLLGNLFDEVHGNALVLVSLNEAEQILAEDLEYHTDVSAIWPLVPEVVEEGDDMLLAWVIWI